MKGLKLCSICGNEIGIDPNGWDGGHNAQPINNGRCCGLCNDTKVTPARLVECGYPEDVAKSLSVMVASQVKRRG